jgi:hypothetical protein
LPPLNEIQKLVGIIDEGHAYEAVIDGDAGDQIGADVLRLLGTRDDVIVKLLLSANTIGRGGCPSLLHAHSWPMRRLLHEHLRAD